MSQDTISISYSEDTRDGYLGYAVANISWERPQGTYCLYISHMHEIYLFVTLLYLQVTYT